MPYLQSDTIEAVSYDEQAHLLTIRFRADGHALVYEGVPQEVYDSLIFADSITEFFATHIAGIYRERDESLGDSDGWPSSLAASFSRSRAASSNRTR
ncbi:MAG: KTSC domain-containing protein [Proteobacteria bacterium]|nr:KTSC domain-containing protein [Pseudomonadota bacterium]